MVARNKLPVGIDVLKRFVRVVLLRTNHLIASIIEAEVFNFDIHITHRTIRVSVVAEDVKDSAIAITPLNKNIALVVGRARTVLAVGFEKKKV